MINTFKEIVFKNPVGGFGKFSLQATGILNGAAEVRLKSGPI